MAYTTAFTVTPQLLRQPFDYAQSKSTLVVLMLSVINLSQCSFVCNTSFGRGSWEHMRTFRKAQVGCWLADGPSTSPRSWLGKSCLKAGNDIPRGIGNQLFECFTWHVKIGRHEVSLFKWDPTYVQYVAIGRHLIQAQCGVWVGSDRLPV